MKALLSSARQFALMDSISRIQDSCVGPCSSTLLFPGRVDLALPGFLHGDASSVTKGKVECTRKRV